MKIVVIGGTGLIGSKLASLLRQRGQEVMAASPDSGVADIDSIAADRIHVRRAP